MAVDLIARGMAENDGSGVYTGGSHITVNNDTKTISTDLHAGTNISIDPDGAINASNDPFFVVMLGNVQNVSAKGNQYVYTATPDKTFMELYLALYRDYKRCFAAFKIPFFPTVYAEFVSAADAGAVGNSAFASCSIIEETSSGGNTVYNLQNFIVEFDDDGYVAIMLETIEEKQLPTISANDAGKYLQVNNYGKWIVGNPPSVPVLAITQNSDPNKPFKSSCTGAEALAAVEANAVITMEKWSGDTAGECYRLASYMKTSTQLVLYFSKVFYNISVMDLQAIAMDITFDLTNPSEFGSLHGSESNLTTH